jgi:hypothetical protein
MKFKDLYKQVLNEDEIDDLFDELDSEKEPENDDIPSPEKFDDVEPLPEVPASNDEQNPDSEGEAGANLAGYLKDVNDFVNKLNNPSGNSLNHLITQLATPGTPYADIARRTVPSIESAAKALAVLGQSISSVMLGAERAKKAPQK